MNNLSIITPLALIITSDVFSVHRCISPGLYRTVLRAAQAPGSKTATVTRPATTLLVIGMEETVKVL